MNDFYMAMALLIFALTGIGVSLALIPIARSIHAIAMALHNVATAITATRLTDRK